MAAKDQALKIDEFFNDRIIVDKKNVGISKNETNFILNLFQKSSYLNSRFRQKQPILNTLSKIGENFEYDSYKFTYENKSYCIKINENDDDRFLEKEAKILKKIKSQLISPTVFHYENIDFGSNISILLTSFENGMPLSNFSMTDVFYNTKAIANHLSYLHEITSENQESETEDFVSEFFSMVDYEDILPKNLFKQLKKEKIFKNNSKILESLKPKIIEEIKNLEEDNICICHTNLNRSRILYRDGYFKFTNFLYAANLDPFWDLALTIFYLGYSNVPTKEKEFLAQYIEKHKDINMTEEEASVKLSKFKKVAYKLVLMKIMALFLYENILYRDTRPSKYVELIRIYEGIRDELQSEFPLLVSSSDEIFYNYKL